MNIHDAVKQALEEGKYITTSEFRGKVKIKPTDEGESWILIKEDDNLKARVWQPTINELIRSDWEVVNDESTIQQQEKHSSCGIGDPSKWHWSCDDNPATHQELRQSEWGMSRSIWFARQRAYAALGIGIADAIAIIIIVIVLKLIL